jgi:hypothetical protein
MQRDWLPSIAAVVLAFLASQHHNLMLLLAIGLGDAEMMSFMTAVPWVRRVMLLLSLAMVAVIGYRMAGFKRARSMRITSAISIIVTIGLAVSSIMRFGF